MCVFFRDCYPAWRGGRKGVAGGKDCVAAPVSERGGSAIPWCSFCPCAAAMRLNIKDMDSIVRGLHWPSSGELLFTLSVTCREMRIIDMYGVEYSFRYVITLGSQDQYSQPMYVCVDAAQ